MVYNVITTTFHKVTQTLPILEREGKQEEEQHLVDSLPPAQAHLWGILCLMATGL